MLRSPGIMRLLYQNSDAVTAVFEAFGQAEGGGMTRPDALRFAKVRRLLQGGEGGGGVLSLGHSCAFVLARKCTCFTGSACRICCWVRSSLVFVGILLSAINHTSTNERVSKALL